MQSILKELIEGFSTAISKAFPDISIPPNLVEVVPSTQDKFGHYQFNSAMKLVSIIKSNPRTIAEKILSNLKNSHMFAKLEIAGPGFINITLDTEYLAERTQRLLNDPHLSIDKINPPQRLVIDFSSPNAAKEMHVGHLRSTIIGDSLARLFEFLGYDVLRINHIGDWGTAFGMLIAHMKDVVPEILIGKQDTDLTHLVKWYKESKKRFDEDAEFKKRSQLEVVALQGGQADSLKAWTIICDISRRSFQEIYDLLDVKLNERGESFYNPLLADVVATLEKKQLIQVSEGAKCIFIEGFNNRDGEPLPIIVQKSDGGYNYSTTDLAAIRHRINEEKANQLIYVTDAGQALHFAMIFKAAEKAGFYDPAKIRIDHVGFGLVLGPDGKKFKTRSGDTERLLDLLLEAVLRAKKILEERKVEMTPIEIDYTAKVLGINAIKYADLSSNRIHDYMFSYDRMLRFDGNTAAFLMYSYVRINGIKRKVGINIIDVVGEKMKLSHPSEIALALHVNQFSEVLEAMTKDLNPHRLAEYLFNLAERFNAFFRDCRVEGDAAQNSRLLLCEAVSKTLKQGMNLLGLNVVDKM